MKKYYARQFDPESFNYELYYDEYAAEEDNIWLGGNRDYITFNADLRADVIKAIADSIYDFDESDKTEWPEIIKCYFKKVSGEFTEEEVNKLVSIVSKYINCAFEDDNDLVCEILEILYGEPFINGYLRGCCQGDWIEYICPVSLESKLAYIEAVFFGTGTELAITEKPIDSEDEFDSTDTYCDYFVEWDTDTLKAKVAEEIGCSVDEVVLQLIEDTKYTKVNTYRNY